MFARIIFLFLFSTFLTSCSEYFQEDTQPKMKQQARTDAMGQTTYTSRPVDDPASR